jgi:hypothetical protein
VTLPERPRRLGRYDVIVKIAGGGMATIYLGRDADRLAAIKVIRHDLRNDDQVVSMFLDEAKILSRMSHPNIAATYEYGVEGEGHFIAMELLLGQTVLDVWTACKARKLALRLEHGAWIAARVADALHHAHELRDEHGVPLSLVHRDVNPANVFLTFDGEVKLFDDIYMLGTTLWEMTTMRRLFRRTQDAETLMAVRAGLVPDPRATVPTYPEELWGIVRRALARNRDERYATAAELARDLDAFVATRRPAEEMPALTGGILDALFPGEREKRASWLRQASALRRKR